MHLFRYSQGIYGDDQLVGASWDLLWWFVAAGLVFIVAHATYKAVFGTRSQDRS
jgi:hypothetical protein